MGLFFLKTDVISANFNLSGKLPVLKISLKSFCKTGAVELVHFLRIFAGILLRAPDFFELEEHFSLSTSSVSISVNEKLLLVFILLLICRILGWN